MKQVVYVAPFSYFLTSNNVNNNPGIPDILERRTQAGSKEEKRKKKKKILEWEDFLQMNLWPIVTLKSIKEKEREKKEHKGTDRKTSAPTESRGAADGNGLVPV